MLVCNLHIDVKIGGVVTIEFHIKINDEWNTALICTSRVNDHEGRFLRFELESRVAITVKSEGAI